MRVVRARFVRASVISAGVVRACGIGHESIMSERGSLPLGKSLT
jgi:hypothetical protein